jgi:tRNA A-37 threonylcarbamoyl transferase component Bud32
MSADGPDGPTFARIEGRGGFRWTVRTSLAGRLFADGVLLPDPLVLGRRTIRRTASRLVEAVDPKAGGPPLIVKTYLRRPGLDDLFRGILYGSSAEIERGKAAGLLRRGIDVPEPIAAGTRRIGLSSESVLVEERIEGAEELGAVLSRGKIPAVARDRIIEALAVLFRRIHDAGAALGDPHLGNLLLAGGFDAPRLIPVDLRRVRLGRRLTERRRASNLALLGIASLGLASRADRRRFIAAYLGEGSTQAGRRALLEAVEACMAPLLLATARRRARRARRGIRRFGRRRAGDVVWLYRTDALPEIEEVLRDPEGAFRSPDRVLKEGRSSSVVIRGGLVVKEFRPKRIRSLFLDRLRLSRPLRGLARSIVLETAGIPTARVLAAGERRRGVLSTGGFLVSREIPGARTLLGALREGAPGPGGAAPARGLLRSAGRLVGRLHQAGISHRDLKALNVLVDGRGRLALVDLDGLRAAGRVGLRRAARDLGRLLRDLAAEAGGPAFVAEAVEGYFDARKGLDRDRFLASVRLNAECRMPNA